MMSPAGRCRLRPIRSADSPGCALGIFQNGASSTRRATARQILEYAVPITPSTPFISGSVAKQFTAAAIALLVEQGRISLDDDVRKYIPELPDYGPKITIDKLVHHTSGLRDFWALVQVAGMRYRRRLRRRRRHSPRGSTEASQLPARYRSTTTATRGTSRSGSSCSA
jgi:CubicO group peptidase (beta-lactamase class C family)